MAITTPLRTPAGWYPDPLGSSTDARRWWNGESWTEYTAPSATLSSTTTVVGVTGHITVHGAASKPTARESARVAQDMPLHTPESSVSDMPRVTVTTASTPRSALWARPLPLAVVAAVLGVVLAATTWLWASPDILAAATFPHP